MFGIGYAEAHTDKEVKDLVTAAIRAGRIKGSITVELAQAIKYGAYGKTSISSGVFHTLAALSESKTIEIFSLTRYGGGPHGNIRKDGSGKADCSAMDITVYDGSKINLINGNGVESTIEGIRKVIENLPSGLFTLGLTRPSPYAKGPQMPDKDVFLPCDDKAGWPMAREVKANFTGYFKNPDAAAAIDAAMRYNPLAQIFRVLMDGPDHLHLEVLSAAYY